MSSKQVSLFVFMGAALWFIAALFVQYFGEILFTGGFAHIATFAATLVLAPTLVWTVAKIISVPLTQMLVPTTILTVTALILDGAAITWTPALYGGPGQTLTYGAAWLLWGVGSVFLSALVMHKTQFKGGDR